MCGIRGGIDEIQGREKKRGRGKEKPTHAISKTFGILRLLMKTKERKGERTEPTSEDW